uniref:Uncharacterized protein n=1 Tax=viral metagenome TaxID=1070528 RepID=A0A6C0CS00_9ZZZZ
MSAVKVFNSSSSQKCTTKTSSKVSNIVQKIDTRRQIFEQARRTKIQRIYKDIELIVKREQEYAKQVFEQLFPVKITWNEDALSQLNNMMPFRIEKLEKEQNNVVKTEDYDADTESEEEEEKLDDTI